jgi:purine nucleoside phosphorylase
MLGSGLAEAFSVADSSVVETVSYQEVPHWRAGAVPGHPGYLDLLQEAGVPVLALGKISEVFVGRGVTAKLKVGSNDENLALLIDLLAGTSDRAEYREGLLFTNLVDFDMAWGHRNDPDGFARGLAAVDGVLPRILELLGPADRLIVSADHGVDPTTVSTDHSREYAPLLLYPRPAGAPAAVYDGSFSDTGATIFSHFTGRKPPLVGESVDRLRPVRGWRRYTPAEPAPSGVGLDTPGRVGQMEAFAAAEWLQERFGPPPAWAVMLGSGLAEAFAVADASVLGTVSYHEVPHWRAGSVPGHPGYLDLTTVAGEATAVLRGRPHGYDGFDLSETQLPVRTRAAWGVGGIILSSAAGAVSTDLTTGDLVVVTEIIDLQQREPDGAPTRILGSDPCLLEGLLDQSPGGDRLSAGVHAAVPGPHYETAAEVAALRAAGADCVSMSLAAETRAAHEEDMTVDLGSYAGSQAGPRNTAEAVDHLTEELTKKLSSQAH